MENTKEREELIEKDKRVVWHPYTQMRTAKDPLAIKHAKGAVLYDYDGSEYIDAVSSWWVNIHGHGKEEIAKAVYEQMLNLEHIIFAGFTHHPAVTLAEELLKILPSNQGRIFYSDNGSTAVEIGIKMAKQYYFNQGIKKTVLVAFENGFHGETFGAMSASGEHKFNLAFRDQLFEVKRIPVPVEDKLQESLNALNEIIESEEAYAFIFEPLIQGAGGMVMYPPEHLDALIKRCQENGILCIADEVMTGFGRTAENFASNHLKEQADIICMAKGLTGGTIPLSVTSCTEQIYEAFLSEDKYKTFFHGHSYTANPTGCAAALASLKILNSAECKADLLRISKKHHAYLTRLKESNKVKNVRQTGTIIAIEFETGTATGYFNDLRDKLYEFFLSKGAILRPLGNVIYIMPPYCITDNQLDVIYSMIDEAIEVFSPVKA